MSLGSNSEPQVERPRFLVPLAAATMSYLVVEFALNARLLDVTGGIASPTEIAGVARWGRLVSGAALTLAVWGSFLLPRSERRAWPAGRAAVSLVASAAACMAFAWYAERAVVDQVVAAADAQSRRDAVEMRLLSGALLDGSIVIDGLDLSSADMRGAAGKAFLATFPFIGLSTDRTVDGGDPVLGIYRAVVERRYGTAEQVYNGVFIPSVRSLRETYNRYVAAQRRLAEAVAAIPATANAAWGTYVASPLAHGQALARLPRAEWPTALAAARSTGAAVADGWSPGDRRGFSAAFAAAVRGRAEAAYRRDISDAVGALLPVGLDWATFTASEPIQSQWRKVFRAPGGSVLSSDMGFEAFRDQIYKPAIAASAEEALHSGVGSAADFGPGGRLEETGRGAMEWLVVPPLALALSILGAAVHISKTIFFTAGTWTPFLRWRGAMACFLAACLVLAPFFADNAVSSSEAFSLCATRTAKRFGVAPALATQWIVQAQPFFYPVGDMLRRGVLLGFSFR